MCVRVCVCLESRTWGPKDATAFSEMKATKWCVSKWGKKPKQLSTAPSSNENKLSREKGALAEITNASLLETQWELSWLAEGAQPASVLHRVPFWGPSWSRFALQAAPDSLCEGARWSNANQSRGNGRGRFITLSVSQCRRTHEQDRPLSL